MGPTLVVYECVAPDHQPGMLHPDKLTAHDGRWAFCAFDARAEGHEWRATGGTDMSALLNRIGLAVATSAPERAETQAAKR